MKTRILTSLLLLVPVVTAVRQAHAAPTELFFSEYIEGSSNNKALEIYNHTGAAVDLGASGYNVQMFFNGATSAGLTINLTGVLTDGDVFVLAQSSAAAEILAQADQTNGAGWFNGDDAVVLRKGAVILDVIGRIGFDPGSEWGTQLTSTADNTLRRGATVCDGDGDGTDAFDPAGDWEGFETNNFAGLGRHEATCASGDTAPFVAGSVPADGAGNVALNASVTVTFSEPVAVAGDWYALVCSLSGVHPASITGGPSAFTIDPVGSFVGGESCTVTIFAANVSDLDANDPPDLMASDHTFTFTPVDACAQPVTTIPAIQGAGATVAIGGAVTTRGVVIGDFEGPSPALRGFYMQDQAGDGDVATSDGIFVFNGDRDTVSPGDLVVVSGNAGEFQGQSQITASSVIRCGTGTIDPVDVTLPFSAAEEPERFEGMLVRMPQTLYVTEHFQLGRFGQVVLSSGGRLRQPTNVVAPGPAALALQAANDLNRIIVDDERNIQNPDPILFARAGQPLSAANTLRGGDTATGIVGVMTYTWAGNSASGNAYRVRPVGALGGQVAFVAGNPRPSAPPSVGGQVHVAGLNLLNFFDTFQGCTFGAGGAPADCRGADDAFEFDRQLQKTVAAIRAIDADVLGVNEIENDGYGTDSALQTLVDALNTASGPGTYAFIDVDGETAQVNAMGTDAIKVALIYKPAMVAPVGQTAVLNAEAFVNAGDSAPRNRPSLAQAFQVTANGRIFVVDVNHLKSKGSACDAPALPDGQGECNGVRTEAARQLAAWLASDPTGTGADGVLLIGDYNAYAKEDPITTLERAGFTNLVSSRVGPDAYSYVFDGQWGYLDQALGTSAIVPFVTGVGEYHINADEPNVLDYNTNFKSPGQQSSLYAPDAFRMSDHDPVLVGLCFPPRLNVSVSPNRLWPPNHRYVDVQATFAHSADTVMIELVSAVSNEPDNGCGDGDTRNDIVIVDNDTVRLRAERAGKGTGRVYTLTYRATNVCGATVTATAQVVVPRRP